MYSVLRFLEKECDVTAKIVRHLYKFSDQIFGNQK